MDILCSKGFVDTFRHLYPLERKYTYWLPPPRFREKNNGWRIDYFFVSKTFLKCVVDSDIHKDILGSDHCPISL